jgi:hypothetical protein
MAGTKTPEMQEKYAFTSNENGEERQFGPFDTREAADKTRAGLASLGVQVGETSIIWTVASSRLLLTRLRAAQTPPVGDQTAPEVESGKSKTAGKRR